jgi:hypothetical protein
MPFDTEDAMFNPPLIMSGRPSVSLYEYDPAGANTNGNNTPTNNGAPQIVTYDAPPPMVTYHGATPIVPDTPPVARPPARTRKTSDNDATTKHRDRDNVPSSKHRDRDRDEENELTRKIGACLCIVRS